jgi:serine/threonine-protein kinase
MVKLCDFGIAKAVALGDRPLTRPGLVKGKYAYMSPEQTVGTPLDGRSDVYALAIVLWELLAGRTLVPRGDAVAAMHAIRLGNLPPIGQVAPWTPAPLVEAVSWALATNRDQRPTAAQLAAVLEQFLAAASESATSHQLGSWLRAHFPRAPTDPTGEPEATEATPSTPSALSTPFAQAALSARAASSPGAPGAGNLPASAITSSDETSTRFAVPRPSPAAAATTLIADDAAQLLARSGFAPLPTDEGPIFAAAPSQRAATAGGSTGPAQTGFESTDPPGELPVLGAAEQGSAAAPGMPPSPRPRSPSAPGMLSASPLAPANSQHAPPPGSSPPEAPSAPRVSLPSLTGFDHAETILRSGAFRAPVPSGPASVPTLLEGPPPPPPPPPLPPPGRPPAQLAMPEGRPVQMRARPMPGMPMLAGRLGAPQAPARLRIGRVVAVAFGGVALVIALVFGAWRCSHEPRPQPSMFAPRDAGPAPAPSTASAADPAVEDATPADAAVSADADADVPADAGAPTDAAEPADAAAAETAAAAAAETTATTAAAGPMAALDVHTAPAGATVMIRRCRRAAGKCTVDRASAETPIGDCPAAPCAFALPPGSYEVVVELGGAREVRPVKLMTDVATSLDIVFKPAQLRRAGMGRLTLHAPPACKALLDGKTRVQAPLVDYDLKVGAHRLELQCGRRPWPARSVTIAGGKTTSVTLVPR